MNATMVKQHYTFSSYLLSINLFVEKPISKAQKANLFCDLKNFYANSFGVATHSLKSRGQVELSTMRGQDLVGTNLQDLLQIWLVQMVGTKLLFLKI